MSKARIGLGARSTGPELHPHNAHAMDDPYTLNLLSGLVLLLTVGIFLHMGMRSGRLERTMTRLETTVQGSSLGATPSRTKNDVDLAALTDLTAMIGDYQTSTAAELRRLGSIAEELRETRKELEAFQDRAEAKRVADIYGKIVELRVSYAKDSQDPRVPAEERALYREVLDDLDAHLRNLGIVPRSPVPGEEYAKSPLCSLAPEIVPTQDPSQNGRIHEVHGPAWVIDDGSRLTVLHEAPVSVYRIQG